MNTSTPWSLRSLATPLFLGLACLFFYNLNLRQIGAGDTLPARYLPLILWHDGTLGLDAEARLVASGHSMTRARDRPADPEGKILYFEPPAYWIARTRHNQLASLYPVVTPLLVAPLYAPAVLWLDAHGWAQPQLDWVALWMEKLSASLLAAMACVLVYLILRREGSRWSLPLALAFAFGTNTWMISSQALWQHGTGELLIALALLLVLVPATALRTALLGAVCVLMAANRPPDALVAGALGLYVLWSRGRQGWWLLAGAALPLAALLVYNLDFIGEIVGGYTMRRPPTTFIQPGWKGLFGLLVSPTRGLLVFSPFLLFLPVGLAQRLRSPETKWLTVTLAVAVIAQLALYSQVDWRGGVAWGPRWLTDILPILVWMLAPAPSVLRTWTRNLFILALAASVTVQVIGAFWYTRVSDDLIYGDGQDSMGAAWDPRNLPFLTELRHPPAPLELLSPSRGSLDRVGSALVRGIEEVPRLEPGAALEGWALCGDRAPAQLLVLVDGIVIGSTPEFLPRPDVNAALHTTALSGWRVTANLLGIPPGERVLQLAIRIAPRSDILIIREQRVLVIAPEPPASAQPQAPQNTPGLDAFAVRAIGLLREHQHGNGYWLTAHTQGLSYQDPQPEMNTYLTSMLVDMLMPVAKDQGLQDVLARARQHLAAQIERSGLVRYHGLPDGPLIGQLGCVITPDSDDTALVWRLAGPGLADPRAKLMLAELSRYRDVRGLYRTWLSSPNAYQGIDPGDEPDPTDIGIQMHVYLMLRELDPSAAKALDAALQRFFRDEDLWVYYAKAPLIPYLRSCELNRLGCAIPLPVERLDLPAPGQEIWSQAARLLVKLDASPQDAATRQATRAILERLGSDDFALLRATPPLLYHNDLSASVSRYYWSEDFGYALWLRLYQAAGGEAGRASRP